MKTGTTTKAKWTLILGLAVATLSINAKAQTIVTGAADASSFVISELADVIDMSNTQDISKLPKMDRDIIIMENVLADLFKKKSSSFSSSSRTRGLYVPGNGVIFNVAGNGIFHGSEYVAWDDLVEVVVVESNQSNLSKNYSPEELKKLNEVKKEKIALQAKTFLADYGSLLGELKDNEKIQVSVNYTLHVQSTSRKIEGQFALVSSSRDENKRRMTAEISVRDLKAYTTGSLSQSQVFSRIKVNSYDVDTDDMLDAKILAGIFDDVFKYAYDGYLKRSGSTKWSYFDGFGLMFNINLSSSGNRYALKTVDGRQVITHNNEKTVDADKFYKDIQSKYPAFEKMVKENLIKYGRTLRSLKSNEVVIINVGLNSNRRSGLPSNIQFMIPKSEIDAFTKGDKSLNQVMDAINLKKLKASLGGSGAPTYIQGSGRSYASTEGGTAYRSLASSYEAVRSTVRDQQARIVSRAARISQTQEEQLGRSLKIVRGIAVTGAN